MLKKRVVIVGAGPAGLTAAYKLSQQPGIEITVLEADNKYLGGISKTVQYKGYRFDIGGHRFFSKSQEIENLWTEILGSDIIVRSRKSHIFYRGLFFSYPLKPLEALLKLGIVESIFCVASYLKAKAFPYRNPKTFEKWVVNQFGYRLFTIFFKTYTEKIWGMSCKEISADWAAQRIQSLSLFSILKTVVIPARFRKSKIKTLIEFFRYPRLGPGMMWEKCAELAQARGTDIKMGASLTNLSWQAQSKSWLVTYKSDEVVTLEADHIILSSAMGDLAKMLNLNSDSEVYKHCNELKYRDFISVALIANRNENFDDNWLYIHDSNFKVGRIQNYRSWSPDLIPNEHTSCYGLEYFCLKNDSLWDLSDQELIAFASQELVKLKLAKHEDILDGYVIRQPRAYPVYDQTYRTHILQIRQHLESHYQNIHLVGRNGMHKYNNQDHSMMSAILSVQNILSDSQIFDVWNINEDASYSEDTKSNSKISARLVPNSLPG